MDCWKDCIITFNKMVIGGKKMCKVKTTVIKLNGFIPLCNFIIACLYVFIHTIDNKLQQHYIFLIYVYYV